MSPCGSTTRADHCGHEILGVFGFNICCASGCVRDRDEAEIQLVGTDFEHARPLNFPIRWWVCHTTCWLKHQTTVTDVANVLRVLLIRFSQALIYVAWPVRHAHHLVGRPSDSDRSERSYRHLALWIASGQRLMRNMPPLRGKPTVKEDWR